eukprot:679227-Pleurochrysis_carterae.AAC.3
MAGKEVLVRSSRQPAHSTKRCVCSTTHRSILSTDISFFAFGLESSVLKTDHTPPPPALLATLG